MLREGGGVVHTKKGSATTKEANRVEVRWRGSRPAGAGVTGATGPSQTGDGLAEKVPQVLLKGLAAVKVPEVVLRLAAVAAVKGRQWRAVLVAAMLQPRQQAPAFLRAGSRSPMLAVASPTTGTPRQGRRDGNRHRAPPRQARRARPVVGSASTARRRTAARRATPRPSAATA